MIEYRQSPKLENQQLNVLFCRSWENWKDRDFRPVLTRNLGHIAAFENDRLIGFVNIAWDGGEHAFLLDTTVHPDFQRRGIGTQLTKEAIQLARNAKASWLHVDFEQKHSEFYLRSCGFKSTAAGLFRLD